MFIAITIGPIGGFFITSATTSLYVDFNRIPADAIPDLHQYDPRWIGAWWLAFPIFSVLLIIVALPMFFYPKEMIRVPTDDEKGDQKPVKDEQEDDDDMNALAPTKGSIFSDTSGGIVHMIKGIASRGLHNIQEIYLICVTYKHIRGDRGEVAPFFTVPPTDAMFKSRIT